MARTAETISRSVRVRVAGRVQGVGYRFFAVRAAESCGVTGFVRNLEDGAVEVRADGSGEAVSRFLAALRSGPSASKVEDFEVLEGRAAGGFRGFEVRY